MNTNSNRCSRTTDEGYYKSTGQVREVKAELSQAVIGNKRILPFLEGRAPKGKITKYVMHEFSLPKTKQAQLGPNPNQQREFVLNHLTTKSVNYKKRKYDSICDKVAEPGIASNYKDDQAAAAANMILEPKEHLADKDVLLGSEKCNEGAESESVNGSCLIDNNDISTLDVGLLGGCFSSGSDNLAVNDSFHEVSFQPERNLISPFHPSSLRDIPLISPVHTGLLGDVVNNMHYTYSDSDLLEPLGGVYDSYSGENIDRGLGNHKRSWKGRTSPLSTGGFGNLLIVVDIYVGQDKRHSEHENHRQVLMFEMPSGTLLFSDDIHSCLHTREVLREESDCKAVSQDKVSDAAEYCFAFHLKTKSWKHTVGQSGRGSGRLSKWSRVRALVDVENFLGRGPRICARQYLGGLGLGHAWGCLKAQNLKSQ
ncbi:unnamed protein product [Prunus armeniaca]|uniref:NAC domain-containing protein n=1 Tax=Prunus armeniaca TaxID=36596 RepID=A0A6J5U5G1_PRUAR|nr:unnamed protein product [Prunus armeniaca]CAB4300784.1 unnamed protein product [Prunus armeniaca]